MHAAQGKSERQRPRDVGPDHVVGTIPPHTRDEFATGQLDGGVGEVKVGREARLGFQVDGSHLEKRCQFFFRANHAWATEEGTAGEPVNVKSAVRGGLPLEPRSVAAA